MNSLGLSASTCLFPIGIGLLLGATSTFSHAQNRSLAALLGYYDDEEEEYTFEPAYPNAPAFWKGGSSGSGGISWNTTSYWLEDLLPNSNRGVFINQASGYPVIQSFQAGTASSVAVGDRSNGRLDIQALGNLSTTNEVIIGFKSSVKGELTASGGFPTSQPALSVGSAFVVGWGGEGTFKLLNGAKAVQTGEGINSFLLGLGLKVGQIQGGVGTVLLSGTDTSLAVKDQVWIGGGGNGTLTVEGGALLTTDSSNEIASSGEGNATVTGANSLWSVGTDLTVGGEGKGTLTISNGGKVTTEHFTMIAFLGNSSESSVTVTGANSLLDIGTYLTVGQRQKGALTIGNGGRVTTGGSVNLAMEGAQSGNSSITVTGEGSLLSIGADLTVGHSSSSAVTISEGGRVDVGGSVFLSDLPSSWGGIYVTGPNSRLTADRLIFSRSATGSLSAIYGGGRIETTGSSELGSTSGSNAGMVVGGHLLGAQPGGSQFINGEDLTVGKGGSGVLTIFNEGLVSARNVTLAATSGSSGSLILHGSSDHRGLLTTHSLTRGSGAGTIEFKGGILRATAGKTLQYYYNFETGQLTSEWVGADLISNFEAGDIQILSGAFIDTQAYFSVVSSALQGAGGLSKAGTGVLQLSQTNTYAGATTIDQGTLCVGNGGANGTLGSGPVNNSGILKIDRNNTYTIANSISGSGQFVQAGTGTTSLEGTVTYTGDTRVEAGILVAKQPYFADSSSIEVASNAQLKLDFSGTGTVKHLTFGGVSQAAGTWGAPNSGADHESSRFAGAGKLLVTEQLHTEPFAIWINTFPSLRDSGQIALEIDPDRDGRSNLLEFALDGDPTAATFDNKQRTLLSKDSNVLTLTYTLPVRIGAVFHGPGDLVSEPIDGMVYSIQATTDFSDFTTLDVEEVAPAIDHDLPDLSQNWEYRTFKLSDTSGKPRAFMRVKVTPDQP